MSLLQAGTLGVPLRSLALVFVFFAIAGYIYRDATDRGMSAPKPTVWSMAVFFLLLSGFFSGPIGVALPGLIGIVLYFLVRT